MNIVGPLANPASAGRQVVGVADARRVPLIAGARLALGTEHARVVHGEPGMDEVSPLGPTHVVEIRHGRTTEWTIDPTRFGMAVGRAEELAGGPPAENAAAVRAVLGGDAPPTARAAVLLNAAAAIFVSTGDARTFGEAIEVARAALDTGAGLTALERLRRAFAPATS
jgi:anthranilate phosphoribosyltransferase